MGPIHLSQMEITENNVSQNPPGGLSRCCCCGQVLCCPGSILIYAQYLEDTVTTSSTEPTVLEDTQTSLKITVAVPSTEQTMLKTVEFWSATKEHVHDNMYNSRLCNTPVEPKEVNLQPSPSPPPAVALPEIRDPGPGPLPSQGDGCLIGLMANGENPDIALQAASVPLPSDEEADLVREDLEEEDGKDEIVTMAQVNREEWCKATANVDNTQVHNAALQFQICSRAPQQFLKKPSPGLPASTVLVGSSFETSQEPLVLSTHQLHLYRGLNLSSTEQEQMAVYQRAIEGINDRNGRHVIILTTLPNMDQWAISLVQCVNTAREFIRTKVKEGIITLRIRHEDKVEVTNEVIETPVEEFFEELTWAAAWNLINDEVEDEVVEDEVNGGNKMKRDKKCTVCKGWEHLEEAMRKWCQAIARRPALPYLWTALYNLVFPSNTPQKHIKIDDEERQLSDQYYSFPHRPRSRCMPILKMLLLNLLLLLLLLAYLISSDKFLSSVYIGSRTRPNDLCSEEW
jgi:hypothetical protein